MLDELLIRDVGVIEQVTLRLAPGLNVLTGETGAGKTMVVSCIALLLGGRADAQRVRAGASAAVVEGRLRPVPPGADEWSRGDDELVVSREVAAAPEGTRSRARIGGRLAPVSALADALGAAVEIHGQAESWRLAQPGVQRHLLDRFGGPSLAATAAGYREAYERWRAAASELDELRTRRRERAGELDRLRFELAEIESVGPVAGEEETLDAELARLEHAEGLRTAASAAAAAIVDDGGARDGLGAAVAALRSAAGIDESLDELGRRVEGLAAEAQDVGLELGSYAQQVALDPARLEELRARRAALGGLTRKYGADAAAVAAYADEARARAGALAGGDERAAALHAEVAELAAAVRAAAQRLTEARRDAGAALTRAVEAHLADMAMGSARLQVDVEPAEPGPTGADSVRFLLAAHRGQPPLPLAGAASGGERSRVALAVRLALTDADDTPVLVFDEVDAGVGGAVALDVGRKLAGLARGGDRQVLCVTHLAQIAAFADAHFVVTKDDRAGRAVAAVRRLDEPERVTELARMLSGSSGEAATRHAAQLLATARGG